MRSSFEIDHLVRPLIALLLLIGPCADVEAAQPPSVAQAVTTPASAACEMTATSVRTLEATQTAHRDQNVEVRLLGELNTTAARLKSVEATLSKSTDRVEAVSWRSFWIALTAIVAAFVGQLLLIRHLLRISREEAAHKISNAYAEWQLKQLQELYGPLRALLGQSNVMYRQMNVALAKSRPDLFRLEDRKGEDFDDKVFELLENGSWRRFRTVRDLGDVYNKGYGVEPYFDDVIRVGKRMVVLIEEKAGYARPDAKNLISVMGMYLAHYAVLSRLHKCAQKGKQVAATHADQEAVFPVEFQKIVDKGYEEINAEVIVWRAQMSTRK